MPADRTPAELAELIRADTSIDLTPLHQHLAPVIEATAEPTPNLAKTFGLRASNSMT